MNEQARWHVYEDASGEWRWRLVAGNGRIIADSGEGYVDRSGVVRAINIVKQVITLIENEPIDD